MPSVIDPPPEKQATDADVSKAPREKQATDADVSKAPREKQATDADVSKAPREKQTKDADVSKASREKQARHQAVYSILDLDDLEDMDFHFFGREAEKEMLHQAWADPDTSFLIIEGIGGIGKTALVQSWLEDLRQDRGEATTNIAIGNFSTLPHKDVELQLKLLQTEVEEMVESQKVGSTFMNLLTIIEGAEIFLSYPLDGRGSLQFEKLSEIFKLSRRASQQGFCVITTRWGASVLAESINLGFRRITLGPLASEAGVQILKHNGVRGASDAFITAVEEWEGHPEALQLLSSQLIEKFEGDLRQRDKIQGLHVPEKWDEPSMERMFAYLKGISTFPASSLFLALHIIGPHFQKLFPLLTALPLAGVGTDPKALQVDVRAVISLLQNLSLATPRTGQPNRLDSVFKSYLNYYYEIRIEHFNIAEGAWQKEIHSRLFSFYSNLPNDRFPASSQDIEALYKAMEHGIAAGKSGEVLQNIYWERICRGNEYWSTKVLGLVNQELKALTHFFEEPWSGFKRRVRSSEDLSEEKTKNVEELDLDPAFFNTKLSEEDKFFLISVVGSHLIHLGRLSEAKVVFEDVVLHNIHLNLDSQPLIQVQLCDIALLTGNIEEALNLAQSIPSVGQGWLEITRICTLARCRHHMGDSKRALMLFTEAEELQRKIQPEVECLYSVLGRHFCSMLFDEHDREGAKIRAEAALQRSYANVLDQALAQLTLVGCAFQDALDSNSIERLEDVLSKTNQVIELFEQVHAQTYLPGTFIMRSRIHRYQKKYREAEQDIVKAELISTISGMRLYQALCDWEYASLALVQGNESQFQSHLEQAKGLAKSMGFLRILPFLEGLEAEQKANSYANSNSNSNSG